MKIAPGEDLWYVLMSAAYVASWTLWKNVPKLVFCWWIWTQEPSLHSTTCMTLSRYFCLIGCKIHPGCFNYSVPAIVETFSRDVIETVVRYHGKSLSDGSRTEVYDSNAIRGRERFCGCTCGLSPVVIFSIHSVQWALRIQYVLIHHALRLE